jgi:hypothetical protein
MRLILAALALFAAVASGSALSQTSPYSGGTGVRNANSSTLTLSGPLSITGPFSAAITLTAPTSIIWPTSGTLATTAQIAGGTLAGSFTTLSASTLFTTPGTAFTAWTSIVGASSSSGVGFGSTFMGVNVAPTTNGSNAPTINNNSGGFSSASALVLNPDTNSGKLIQFWAGQGVAGTPLNNILSGSAAGITIGGTLSSTSFNDDAGNLIISSTNPTIASGFGTGPTCSPCNNTAAFKVTVGTGGLDSTGVITMPTASGGWACHVLNLTDTSTAHMLRMTAMSTTSLTVTNSIIGGGNQPFGVANVLLFQCAAF